MAQILEEAREELKRADHLLYVSLKYTRTVDVIKNLIERHISAIDAVISGLLDFALEKKRIDEKPENKGLQAELARKVFKDETVNEMIDFNMWLKQINRADFSRAREFRRHVTMTAHLDSGDVEINIDIIKEHYLKTTEYVEYAERLIFGEKED